MKTITIKEAFRIAAKKKSERTLMEQAKYMDWINVRICPPVRVLLFPFMLIYGLYRWTYWEE